MKRVVGIDEVGRGCWAGPVVAGAVLLHKPIHGLHDSKVLTTLKRKSLANIIRCEASVSLGWVTNQELDQVGLTEAVRLAMQRALDGLTDDYEEVIIDGSYNFLPHIKCSQAVVRADGSVAAVSAASIVAKVARDGYMHEQAVQFPQFGFERHVGYGTKVHRDAIDQYGICSLHRMSFRPIKQAVAVLRSKQDLSS